MQVSLVIQIQVLRKIRREAFSRKTIYEMANQAVTSFTAHGGRRDFPMIDDIRT